MGNDGGSIPKRRELVKESAKPKTLSDVREKQREHLAHRWSQCPLSHTALKKPVVADYAGDLYNKDAIIQFLLPDDVSAIDKVEAAEFLGGRVKSLKDVVEVQFETERDEKTNEEKWICPVTSKELGPTVKAVYIVPCGHAFSHEAIKEMKSNECVQCSQPYESPRDVVPIFPITETDKDLVQSRVEKLREMGLTHSLKKEKGGKKRKAKDAAADEDATAENPRRNGASKVTTIKDAATANLTSRVLEEEEAKKRQRLLNESETIQSLYTKKGAKPKDSDFMTRGYSIPAGARHT